MKRMLPFAATALVLAATATFAQPPQRTPAAPKQERNLKVFPADMPQERLMLMMRSFSQALGVQCSFCHVPGNFASDENHHKDIARGMMRMTMRLNQELLPGVAGLHNPRVSCYSCHRGASSPAVDLPAAAGAPKG